MDVRNQSLTHGTVSIMLKIAIDSCSVVCN